MANIYQDTSEYVAPYDWRDLATEKGLPVGLLKGMNLEISNLSD
jgi:hypothetical protein